MALFKAVKVEVTLLTEITVTNKEIVEWVRDAMIEFCGYIEARAKIVEVHDNITATLCEEASA